MDKKQESDWLVNDRDIRLLEWFVRDYSDDLPNVQGQRAAFSAMAHLLRTWRGRMPNLDIDLAVEDIRRCQDILHAFAGRIAIMQREKDGDRDEPWKPPADSVE